MKERRPKKIYTNFKICTQCNIEKNKDEFKGKLCKIYVHNKYVMIYDPSTFSPIYSFLIENEITSEFSRYGDLYNHFYNFLPQLSNNIEIYAMNKNDESEFRLLPNYLKDVISEHRSF
jgi:hypothetical protein